MKKSRIVSLKRPIGSVYSLITSMERDKVGVYAAQSAFFIIISSIPLLLLIISLAKYAVDLEKLKEIIKVEIDGDIGLILRSVLEDVTDRGGIPLISVSALAALWGASKGVRAVTRGVAEAYGVKKDRKFYLDIVRSILYTLAFILIIAASLLALVFADSLMGTVGDRMPVINFILGVMKDSSPIAFGVILTLFFSLLYSTVSKKGKRLGGEDYSEMKNVPRGFPNQLPGAIFAAVGWVLFSVFYSLYIRYVPSASYIYGSVAAIMFLMLWIYFCLEILLVGAEINKLLYKRRRR